MDARTTRWLWIASAAVLFHAATPLRADDSPMTPVGLKDHEITGLASTPEGDVLAATEQGVWRVRRDAALVTQLPTSGLPLPPEKCLVTHVACSSKGDVFVIPGRGTDGVYRLRAGAGTWESIGKKALFLGVVREKASSLALLPGDVLFVAMSNPSIYRGETVPARLYRSKDAGDTWSDVTPDGIGGASIYSVVGGAGREVWAIGGPGLSNTADPTRWVLVADDRLAARPAWRLSAIQPSPKPGAVVGEPSISSVAVDHRGVAFALVTSGRGCPPGVYRSTDKGGSWQRVNDAQEINVVITTPDDHAYFGSYGGVVRSSDGGATWAGFAGLGKTFVTSLLVDRDGHLWAGTGSHGQLYPVPGLFHSKAPVGSGAKADTGPVDDATPTNGESPAPGAPLFDNGNTAGVENGPSVETTFTLRARALVTRITTYHWNSGRGAKPGTVALRGADGRTYGPWTARGRVGQGGVPNAYWDCEPGVRLEPGTYVVVDSDVATWAQNAPSGRRGIVRIEGAPVAGEGEPGR